MQHHNCPDTHSSGCFSGFGRLRNKLISRLAPSHVSSQNPINANHRETGAPHLTNYGFECTKMASTEKDAPV